MKGTRQLTTIAVLTAMALVLQIVEGSIPNPIPIPGIKLGLANIVGLWALYGLGFQSAIFITVLRVVLGSLLTGSLFSVRFLLGGSGAIVSLGCMALARRYIRGATAIGISIIGAVAHNITQLVVAMLLINQEALGYYLPMLLLAALPAGLITGYFTNTLLRRIKIEK